MKRTQLGMILFVAMVFLMSGVARAGDVVLDIKKVKGIDKYDGPETGKDLLKKNGFVVVPSYHHRIFSPYYASPLPRFITADSVHRTFHVIFEDQLKKVETTFMSDLTAMTDALFVDLKTKHKRDKDCDAVIQYLLVARTLLLADSAGDEDETVAEEVERITSAAGISKSPLFGYNIDYSQFKPRGFYTETTALRRYFKAMSWYGNTVFRLKSDKETRMATLLSSALKSNKVSQEYWLKLDRTYSYLVAETDDLTPLEYANASKDINYDRDSSRFLKAFRKKAKAMRDPKINSMILSPSEMVNWIEHSKGMRLFGKRYIPDSEVFIALTDPNVPGRGFPTGLDVMVANGSKQAEVLMAKTPDVEMPGYAEGMKKSLNILETLKTQETPSHYVELLKVAEAITSAPDKTAASFAQTTAYAEKNVMTALSSWASLRHAWVLHTKQSSICLGARMSDPMPGYLEPNPVFFKAMRRVTRRSIEIFSAVQGAEVERFEKFDELLGSLQEMLRKQSTGEAFTKEELDIFEHYANVIGELQGFRFNMNADTRFPWMSLICDVHTEALTQKCLQVGTGGAMPIYVVVEQNGVPHLLKGAVYSYYEFKQPMSNRLTDEEWRALWDAGKMPKMPMWTRSFIADYDVESLIDRAWKGEIVSELLFIDDPKIDTFFENAMESCWDIARKKSYGWILRGAAIKLKGNAVPTLLDILQTGEVGDYEKHEYKEADHAAEALAYAVGEKGLPSLLNIALGKDKDRARLAVRAGCRMPATLSAKFLGQYLTSVSEDCFSRDYLKDLDYRPVSKDIAGTLLVSYRNTSDQFRKRVIVEMLANAWTGARYGRNAQQPVPTASGAEIEEWEKELRMIVADALDGDDNKMWNDAMRLAEFLEKQSKQK